jgi:hypothetical protein
MASLMELKDYMFYLEYVNIQCITTNDDPKSFHTIMLL